MFGGGCCCWPWGWEAQADLLLPSADGLLATALLEDWFELVSSRDPKRRRKVYARLTAEAVALYEGPPVQGCPKEAHLLARKDSRSQHNRPLDVVWLSQVSKLLGRAKDSDKLRLATMRGDWWELHSEAEGQVPQWVQALSDRLGHFRQAARVSRRISRRMERPSVRVERPSVRVERPNAPSPASSQSSPKDGAAPAAPPPAPPAKPRRRSRLQRLASCLPCAPQPDGGFSQRVSDQQSPYKGSREGGFSSVVNRERLLEVSDPDLQEAQAAQWSDQAVRFLTRCERIPEGLSVDFSLTLRFGVPDGLKRLIWALAAGQALDPPAGKGNAEEFYSNLLIRAFGSAMPIEFRDPVPTFCQGIQGLEEAPPLQSVVKHLWLFTKDGETVLRRLLWCTQLTSHIEFCPFLPQLFATLLLVFSEAEAALLVHQIIRRAESDPQKDSSSNPRIILTRQMINKQAKLLVREGKKRQNAPEALAHLEQLGLDVHAVAAELLQDGCAHALPFRGLCRVVGSFLAEGSEVILRYALALLKLHTPAILACKTADVAKEKLRNLGCDLGAKPEAIDRLTKVAYSLALRDTSMSRVSSNWGSSYVAPKQDYSPHIFCRPRLFEPRGNCPDELWEVLWSWVPATCRILDPRLVYAPSIHGTSARTLLELCKSHKSDPMIFFCYTKSGDVLGGFSPQIWVRTVGYIKVVELNRPVEDAFVFRKPRAGGADVFIWSGGNELLFQASEVSGFAFGGDGAAISWGKDLQRAHTHACASFGSPVLVLEPSDEVTQADPPLREESNASLSPGAEKSGVDFELVHFEVFALV